MCSYGVDAGGVNGRMRQLLNGADGQYVDTAAASAESSEAQGTGENGGESKYQTTYGSKQFDDVTITVELFDRSNAPGRLYDYG